MKSGVVPPFRKWKPLGPVFRLIKGHTSKVAFKTPVDYLGLAIDLRMISYGSEEGHFL